MILLATICLNEIEWLPALYEQHKAWPEMVKWVFIEGADKAYADANPDMVTSKGTSVDGTTKFLADLAASDDRVVHIKAGKVTGPKYDEGKCGLRQLYLDYAEQVKPEFVFVLDADEFYMRKHQGDILTCMRAAPELTGYRFRHHTLWRPQSIKHLSRFEYEAVGSLWSLGFCRGWRWVSGMNHYNNHSTPFVNGHKMYNGWAKYLQQPGRPVCLHLGFTSVFNRKSKHRYYEVRGEGKNDHRAAYPRGRRAHDNWEPGMELPDGANVVKYRGPIPEVFQ